METLNETQTQNKNATSLWQTIGMYIGMMVGFLYPQIGLGLGMLLGIALGRLVLTKIPVNTPLAQRAQQKSAIILILAFLILCFYVHFISKLHKLLHLCLFRTAMVNVCPFIFVAHSYERTTSTT